MDSVIFTPRLKLTLITKAERGSEELEWLHELRSDPQSMWWSLGGPSKTLEDTEKAIKGNLPTEDGEGYQKYHVVYAVHEILEPARGGFEGADQTKVDKPTRFIGRVDLKSLGAHDLVLPEHLTVPTDETPTTLSLELAYGFLPSAWGKGYATESIAAIFETGKKARSFWIPWLRVYVRVIVNEKNLPSLRVMEKTAGMKKKGIYEWKGKAIFLAGEWREEDRIVIFGTHLLE